MQRKLLQGRGWRILFTVQACAALALVVACVRMPTDVEDARYTGEYEGRFKALFAAGSEPVAEPVEPGDGTIGVVDTCPGCGPPFHAANSLWHVFDSHTGTKAQVHRLATQWHNGNTRWAVHTPASNWRWITTSTGSEPVVADASDASATK